MGPKSHCSGRGARFPGWAHDNTLGGKAKDFWWKMDEKTKDVTMKRFFKNGPGTREVEKVIKGEEMDRLHAYMGDYEWKDLANSVVMPPPGTEREGIGWFLCKNLRWGPTGAQLASHLAAIMVHAGVWKPNGPKRGMQFKLLEKDWEGFLRAYFKKASDQK